MQLSRVLKGHFPASCAEPTARAGSGGRSNGFHGRIRECIDEKDKTKQLPEAIAQGYTTYGMQTFDQSLMHLYTTKFITYEEALRQSSNPDDFASRFPGFPPPPIHLGPFRPGRGAATGEEKIAIEKSDMEEAQRAYIIALKAVDPPRPQRVGAKA
jgi:hypothetical protein